MEEFYRRVASENQEKMIRSYLRRHRNTRAEERPVSLEEKIDHARNVALGLDSYWMGRGVDPDESEECKRAWEVYEALRRQCTNDAQNS